MKQAICIVAGGAGNHVGTHSKASADGTDLAASRPEKRRRTTPRDPVASSLMRGRGGWPRGSLRRCSATCCVRGGCCNEEQSEGKKDMGVGPCRRLHRGAIAQGLGGEV